MSCKRVLDLPKCPLVEGVKDVRFLLPVPGGHRSMVIHPRRTKGAGLISGMMALKKKMQLGDAAGGVSVVLLPY